MLHSSIISISAQLIPKIMTELQDHITEQLLANYKTVQVFSISGLQQLSSDIEFFKRVFDNTFGNSSYNLSVKSMDNLSQIYLTIVKKRSDPKIVIESILKLVEKNIKSNSTTYGCFNS